MTTPEEPSKKDLYTSVSDFYNGKSLFITGAAGFVGMILMEILLRTCPGIHSIYILLREKKGVKPEQRKEQLFQKVIFDQLKADQPDALGKVRVVAGDVALPDLGMSEEDKDQILQNVSIVFHCAADVSFVKPMKYMVGTNAVGTHYAIELCKQLKELEAFVYTSTICSNCNRSDCTIEEEVYRLPFASEKFMQEFKVGTEESLEDLVSKCKPCWPNSYTFSKCLAENIVLENASEVPSAIIRPPLVFPTWKAPHAGFCEKNSTLMLLSEASGKGFIKVMYIDGENHIDYIPADVVANCHIIAAWKIATQRSKKLYVVNCSNYEVSDETFYDLQRLALTLTTNHSVPNCFRTPRGVLMVKNHLEYKIRAFYEHYVPAYVIDFLLKLSGNKLRLTRLYNLFDKAMVSASFFTHGWFPRATTNFRTMEKDLNESDKNKYYTDVSDLNLEIMGDLFRTGSDFYDWKTDRRSKKDRLRIAAQRHYFTQFIKYAFLIITFTIVYFISSKVYQLVW